MPESLFHTSSAGRGPRPDVPMKQAWAVYLERRAGEGRYNYGVLCPYISVVMGDVDDIGEFGRPNIPHERLMQQRTHTGAALCPIR